MSDTAAFPDGVLVGGMVVAAGLAAGAVLGRTVRGRAYAMLGALVITPVLLVGEIWNSPQLDRARSHPAEAGVAGVVALALLAVLAWWFAKRPTWLCVLALAALPFRIPVQAGGSTANLLVPLYIVIGAGALAWLVPRLSAVWQGEPAPRSGALEWVLLGSVVLYAVQAIYADGKTTALQNVVFFYVPFALLFALLRSLEWTPTRLKGGGGALLSLALAFTAVGFWEFHTRRLLLNPKVIASNQVEEYFRVNSLFFDPNIYGRFLALVMIGLAAVLLWGRVTRNVWLAVAALVVLWGGLLTSLSQSSFAALLLGLFVLAWMRFGGRAVIVPAGVVVAGALVLIVAFPSSLHLNLDSSDSVSKATSGRANLIEGGLRLARDKPLLGWGSGTFQHQYRRHEHASDHEATAASHTIPITVAAEQGIVGLAFYVALVVLALRRLLRGARRFPPRAVIAAGFAALLLHTWVYAAFLEDPMTWTLLALGTALALPAAAAGANGGEETASRNGRPSATPVPATS
jgi:hypothetical protein